MRSNRPKTGTRVDEVCRKMGISEATFYNWKKKYGGLGGLRTAAASPVGGRKLQTEADRR